MKPSEQRWPAQTAPDDFADRVVSVAMGASEATAAAEFQTQPRSAVARRVGHPALAWAVAATMAAAMFFLYIEERKPAPRFESGLVDARLLAAQEEVARQAREIAELKAKLAALTAERAILLPDRMPTRRTNPVKAPAAAGSPAASRDAGCGCQPGDELCSCL